VAAPACDPALQRALAAGLGVLLRAPGAAPHVFGEPLPPERVIPSAAATIKASLVVLDFGRSPAERRAAALMVGSIGCSVLAVPRGFGIDAPGLDPGANVGVQVADGAVRSAP
jgi:hypothetical protein